MPLRIIFMGTPHYSVPALSALIDAGHEIVAVYSQPPRRSGRGMEEKKSPIHELAEANGVPVFTPKSLKSENEQREFAGHNADLAVVVAYGLILPKAILDAPPYGCINAHASLLPRWRGAAPIQRAIEAGDNKTGVMIMQMEEGLDTGPVMMQSEVAINDRMSAGELHDILARLTGELLLRAIDELAKGKTVLTPQSKEGVTYAKKITKSQSRINWDKPAQEVHNHIRAMSPFPGAWCEINLADRPTRVKILNSELVCGNGKPGTVLDDRFTIACKKGAIRPRRLQKAGKKPGDLSEFLRGNKVPGGTVLT